MQSFRAKNKDKHELILNQEPHKNVKCLAEAIEWLFDEVDKLQVADKDILVVIGPSRVGKGTLLAALSGQKMKMFKKSNKKVKQTDVGKSATVQSFIAPVDPEDEDLPIICPIISHSHNSHTFRPKIIGNGKYTDDFKKLNGTYLIDFPGLFDSKGSAIEIAIYLALQRLLVIAKSAKVLLLLSAQCLQNDANHIITVIKKKLNLMFQYAKEHLTIAITKNRMVQDVYEYDQVLEIARGDDNE